MTDRELMQMALLKMEYMLNNGEWYKPEEIIEALRARLAQPESKPACWLYKGKAHLSARDLPPAETIPLYTAPPQREWQGLTLEEVFDIWSDNFAKTGGATDVFARAIEAKLKEKNNAL